MDPGFYDIPNETYQKETAVSKSDLTLFARSPAHYKCKEKRKETPALIFGDAVHTAILQPDIYIKRYAFFPEDHDGRNIDGRARIKEAKEKNLIPLSWNDSGRIGEMKEAIRQHPTASKLIYGEGPAEISGFWVDERTGLECRLRADKIRSDLGIVIDLKTCEDARFDAFQRSIATYRYHWQGAHYLDGVSEITGIPHTNFVLLAIEKEPPFAISIYRIDDAAIYAGREEIKILMNEFRECKDRDVWPAYLPEEVQNISLPGWYLKGANL